MRQQQQHQPGGEGSDERPVNGTVPASADVLLTKETTSTADDDMLLPHNEVESLLIPSGGGLGDEGSTKKRAVGGRRSLEASSSLAQRRQAQARKAALEASNNKNGDDSGGSATPPNAQLIKYVALFLLVAQMVGLVLLMRFSRTQKRDPDQPLYLASTAVFVMEVMKLVMCLLVIAIQSHGTIGLLGELKLHVLQSPLEVLKLCVPSLLYTIQNNLLYLALTNLDAATYQVCYQLKILTTALFSAVLLHRRFSTTKWISLVVLTVGVAIVQLSGSGDQHSSSSATNHHDNDAAGADHQREALEAAASAATAAAEATAAVASQNRWVGLVAVLCAAGTSGFAGVWFEKILKGSRTSLWIRNVQMGLPSTLIAYMTVYFKDAAAVQSHGFWQGYNSIVWTVVTVQAVGGLVVAVVVKYADNVVKVFATSFSIVVSCVLAAFLFDFHPNGLFLIGASLVVTATVMYSAPDGAPTKPRRRRPLLPLHSGGGSGSGGGGGIGGGGGSTKISRNV